MSDTQPGLGERRAISGYYAQYHVAAVLILDALRRGTLAWIRVADPDAGRVDDAQLGSNERIDAYQVKWAQYSDPFSFRDLMAQSGNKPSLICQLAEGWTRLREIHPSMRVVVHLVTNRIPSTADGRSIPEGDPAPEPKHFAAFLAQAWEPVHRAGTKTTPPPSWQPAWNALQKASGLSVEDFEQFVHECELEFDYQLPRSDNATTKEQQRLIEDLNHLNQTLFAVVADPQRVVHLTRDNLLAQLGWKERFEYRSRHAFPVNEHLYIPIEASVRRLNEALATLPGGYFAVLGPPGSGKSTLLTQALRDRPERVIRYYAYVPDSREPMTLRGESVNFLHDVVLDLEHAGFSSGGSSSRFDRDQLLERFHQQLLQLHAAYSTSGQKFIIQIDGIDHISREQHPQRSLLHDLPDPEQVPEGVYIVLGSQTDQLAELPDRVQYAIQQQERRIEVQALSREAVFQIVDRALMHRPLAEHQKEHVYVLSDGHPLALEYLLKQLEQCASKEAIQTVLSTTERYTGSIEAQYHSYWRTIENDDELVHLLGLIARMRSVIDLTWIGTWGGSVIRRLRRLVAHYFRIEDQQRWYVFHNSFRLFLLEKTAEDSPGHINQAQDYAFHHELAERCATAPAGTYWSWEEPYHRVLAGEHTQALERMTPDWFRRQSLAFRPIDAIQADIKVALQAASARHDPIAVTRAVLAGAEIDQRESFLDSTAIVRILLGLGELQLAAEYLRDGRRLRLDPDKALQLCGDLVRANLMTEAERVFELAEPLDLLRTPLRPVAIQRDTDELLEAWVEAAIHVRDIRSTITTIRQLQQMVDDFEEQTQEQASHSLQNSLLLTMGYALIDDQRWDGLDLVVAALDSESQADRDSWFWLHVHGWWQRYTSGDQEGAVALLQRVIQRCERQNMTAEQRVAIAEGVHRVLGDQAGAGAWLEDLPPLPSTNEVIPLDAGLKPFLSRFSLIRLRAALGDTPAASSLVPDTGKTREQGVVYFERVLVKVAQLWGQAWRGQPIPPAAIKSELLPLLRFFYRPNETANEWRLWYTILQAQAEFCEFVVRAVAQHGPAAITALCQVFQDEWTSVSGQQYWPEDVQQRTVLALYKGGAPRDWTLGQLARLDGVLGQAQDVSSQVKACEAQAQTWLAVGELGRARQTLERMIRASFGVGYRKDYQLDHWIEWLGLINQVQPDQAPARTAWFLQAVLMVNDTTEDRAARYAGMELLRATFGWSPRRAVALCQWLLKRGLLSHQGAVSALVNASLSATNGDTQVALHIIANFLLPLSIEADIQLATRVIQQIAQQHGRDQAIRDSRYFLDRVNVYAPASSRRAWRRGVTVALHRLGVALRKVGLQASDIRSADEETNSSSWLKLQDGTTLSMAEVLLRVTSTASLRELLTQEAVGSYFDWTKIVASVVEHADRAEVTELASFPHDRLRSARTLALLSRRIRILGDLEGAWLLGEQALAVSQPYGWSRGYDGGSRIEALQALLDVDSARARPLAYKLLVADLTVEWGDWYRVALNLDHILPLLDNHVMVEAVWPEVEAYVQRLFADSPIATQPTMSFDASMDDDTAATALIDLAVEHLEHPGIAVATAAQRTLGELLLAQNAAALAAARRLPAMNERTQLPMLLVLEAVAQQRADLIEPIKPIIEPLVSSPSIAIRQALERLGVSEGRQPQQPPRSLPMVYSLSLSDEVPSQIHVPRPRRAAQIDSTAGSAAAIVESYKLSLDAIAQAAGLSAQNLYYRTLQIMRELAPEASWNATGERALQDVLAAIGLRVTWRRPLASYTQQAMFHVVAELLDAGRIDAEALRDLDAILRWADPAFVLAQPAMRPAGILPLPVNLRDTRSNQQWINAAGAGFEQLIRKTADDRTVLAEVTTVRYLASPYPIEVRKSAVANAATVVPSKNSMEFVFAFITNALVREYGTLEPDEEALILHHHSYDYDRQPAQWLAFNPQVAHALGWHVESQGLFRWSNQQGQIMVESIWWQDGRIDNYPPYLHTEVGEGWLVVASSEATTQIMSYMAGLTRVELIERVIHQDAQKELRNVAARRTGI